MKKTSPESARNFTRLLLKWNREKNDRQMPWKGEKDPYKIWLSEIILQQTRVEQGLNYYNRFIETFPTVHQLAAAPDKKVFKLWEGLGYYTRCRNLIASAKFISNERNGKFPETYEDIKALKGVGPYTAAAISSFAFDLPHAVVDGNVFRVLSRFFAISIPTDSTNGKKYFAELAEQLLDKKRPAIYNQAIMDFGAMICKPAAPLCSVCYLKKDCIAFRNNKVDLLPVKEKKTNIRQRWLYYILVEYKSETAIRQRTTKDIWKDLFEFPLVEASKKSTTGSVIAQAEKMGWLKKDSYEIIQVSGLFKQQLSHQLITGQFIHLRLKRKTLPAGEWIWIKKSQLLQYPFPRFINQWLSGQGF